MPPPETAKLAKLSQLYTQLYPQLNEKGALENKPAEPPAENERNYSEEVENMVRLYFEKLYNGEISASRFASVLKSCRTSNDERQVHFFACTSHTLVSFIIIFNIKTNVTDSTYKLDEARFFNQYPEDELIATGELLGLLIDQHLISYAQLRVTLKLILDALKYPVNSKMFNFGIQALAQFRDRLSEWPQYTLLLSKIEGLRSFPTIVESIATTLKQLAQKDPEGRMMASPKMGNAEALEHEAPNVTTLLQSTSNPTFENPSEKIQERVSFLINNLSANNLKSKSTELKHLLQKPTWGWFSHYLVVRRVSIEPNNHELYSTLLDELEMSTLTDAVIEETYVNINLLLQSEGIVDSSSDRNLLKNLGSWLGRLTIAKNRPIRHKDLSIKDLLLAAYDQNRLVVSIPLVCKILQHACNSKIFKLPNPWLMGSLKFLAELYWTEGLKLNLKFEIEILYKTLDLDLNEIEPTSLLENRGPPGIARSPAPPPPPSSSDATTAGASANSGTGGAADIAAAAVATAMTSPVKPFNQDVAPPPGPPPMTSIATPPGVLQPENRPDIDVTPILNKLQVNPAIAQLMIQHPIIKTTVYAGVSEAFQEVVPANIVTSANIAAISTKEMILKDFATEPDETRVQRAAHAMVQPLASSLAVVTCKEPLCNAIVTLIRTNLTQNGLPEQLADEIASTIATENIKLLCVYIDQLTQARALEDVERNLAPAYASRVNYRKQHQRGGAPFFDVLSLNGAPHTVQLPEALRPSHGISPEQFRLYEGFDQRTYMQQASPMGYHPEAVGPPPPFVGNEPQSSPAMPNANGNMLGAKLEQMLLELDRLVRQAGIHSISQLPPTHDICLLIRQIPLLISQSPSPGQTMLAFVEKVVFMLYQSSSPFALEVYTMFLQSLFEISGEAMKETLSWLIYADDEVNYIQHVIDRHKNQHTFFFIA